MKCIFADQCPAIGTVHLRNPPKSSSGCTYVWSSIASACGSSWRPTLLMKTLLQHLPAAEEICVGSELIRWSIERPRHRAGQDSFSTCLYALSHTFVGAMHLSTSTISLYLSFRISYKLLTQSGSCVQVIHIRMFSRAYTPEIICLSPWIHFVSMAERKKEISW